MAASRLCKIPETEAWPSFVSKIRRAGEKVIHLTWSGEAGTVTEMAVAGMTATGLGVTGAETAIATALTIVTAGDMAVAAIRIPSVSPVRRTMDAGNTAKQT